MVLVSVILPTYNSEKTIERALNSILSQNGRGDIFELEVIVVDDSSTDNTVSILSKFPVRLFKNEVNSGGPNKGRNKGLEKARGQWIIFTDHDDAWLPNRVKTQLSCSAGTKIISCGFQVFRDGGLSEIQSEKTGTVCNHFAANETFKKRLSRSSSGQVIFFGNLMIHHSLKDVKLEEKYGQCDADYLLRLFYERDSTACGVALFNRYEEGLTNLSFDEKYRLNDYELTVEVYRAYSEQFPEESKVGIQKLNAAMARYYLKTNASQKARQYLLNSRLGPVNLLLYFGSFLGTSLVKKLIS